MATITIPTVTIDPVTGLVEYVREIKPYHTKILEVLVEYIHQDCIDVTFEEAFYLSLGQPAESLLELWGWTLSEGQSYFNCNYIFHQVVDVDSGAKTWTVYSDQTSYFSVGDTILYMVNGNPAQEFTINNVSVNGDGNTDITVAEIISPNAVTSGVIVPSSCWVKNETTGVYEYKVGIHWPSKTHVELNQDCSGYGIEFQESFNWQTDETYLIGEQAQYDGKIYKALVETKAKQRVIGPSSYGSPLGSPHGSPIDLGSPQIFGKVFITPKDSPDWTEVGNSIQYDNPILSADSATNSFVIDNITNTPVNFSNWKQVFTYGVKFNVSFTTSNDGEYTVLFTTVDNATDELTIYTIEDVSADQLSPDGIINARPFGYDEPSLCLNQGQSLAAYTHINEKLEFKYVDYSIISSASSAAVAPPGSPWTGSPFVQPPNTFLVVGGPGSPSNLLPGSVLYVTDNSNEGYYKVDSIKVNWDGEGNTLIYIDTVIGSPIPANYNISIANDDTGGFIQIWAVGEAPVLEGIFLEFHDTIGVYVGHESITDTQENPAQSPEVGLAPTSWDAGYWDTGGFDEHLGTITYWQEE